MSAKKSAPPDFRKILESLLHSGHDARRVFDAFTRFAACALACHTREKEYLEEVARWKPEEMKLFADAFGALVMEMETKPFEDVLGVFYMEWVLSHSSASWNGEFHTPGALCELMAQITFGDGSSLPTEGPITVSEPACGAGAMILALGKVVPPDVRRRLRVTAVDVNRTACDLTFINTTLWGIPCRVIHGNTLSLETWGAWSNLHYICPWLPLALRLQTGEAKAQGEPPPPAEMEAVAQAQAAGCAVQSAFDFIDLAKKETAA